MKIVVRVILCLVLLLTATAAFARPDDDGPFSLEGISDGCGSTMNADQCMWGDGSDMSGGNYYFCSAGRQWGQKCQAAMQDLSTTIVYCQAVERTAKCYCDDVTHKVSGNCNYVK